MIIKPEKATWQCGTVEIYFE